MRSVLLGLAGILLASLVVTGPPLPLPSTLGCRPAYADIRQGGLTVNPRHGTTQAVSPQPAARARDRSVEQLVLPGVDLVRGEADTSPLARLYRRLVP